VPYDKRHNLIQFQRRHPARFPRVEAWLLGTTLSMREMEEATRVVDPEGVGITRRTLYRMRISMPNLRTALIVVAMSQRWPAWRKDGGCDLVLDLSAWDVDGYLKETVDEQGKPGDEDTGT
jgi:hypothetical protein